jgi:hypothetical protein
MTIPFDDRVCGRRYSSCHIHRANLADRSRLGLMCCLAMLQASYQALSAPTAVLGGVAGCLRCRSYKPIGKMAALDPLSRNELSARPADQRLSSVLCSTAGHI